VRGAGECERDIAEYGFGHVVGEVARRETAAAVAGETERGGKGPNLADVESRLRPLPVWFLLLSPQCAQKQSIEIKLNYCRKKKEIKLNYNHHVRLAVNTAEWLMLMLICCERKTLLNGGISSNEQGD
jgi:hypothetical protein